MKLYSSERGVWIILGVGRATSSGSIVVICLYTLTTIMWNKILGNKMEIK